MPARLITVTRTTRRLKANRSLIKFDKVPYADGRERSEDGAPWWARPAVHRQLWPNTMLPAAPRLGEYLVATPDDEAAAAAPGRSSDALPGLSDSNLVNALAGEESDFAPLVGSRLRSSCQVVCSAFCFAQIILNVTLSLVFPLGFLWVLFSPQSFISSKPTYAWDDPTPLGVVVASPWIGTLISCGTLPVGLPEAMANGWFGELKPNSARCVGVALPFLRLPHVFRHLACGSVAALLYIPAGLCAFRYLLGPTLRADAMVIACACYIASIPVLVVPLGLLGFAVPGNCERVRRRMPTDGHPVLRVLRRLALAPTC